ncbi:MAG: nuclear transport factor 2 family protein [Hydrococcus sp. Prado102]|jgi:steroid delta-isomerase|nr:nuclear transport factor 2 family protein [Hydrococcus sp. Prado102]
MSPEHIQTIISAYFNAQSAMNSQDWVKNFTEDAVIYDPVGNPPNKVQETADQFFGLLKMAFERLELTQDHVFIASNNAAVKWTMRGWGKNGKQGIAEGISTFKFEESGKIQQVSSYWDDAAMMRQLRD